MVTFTVPEVVSSLYVFLTASEFCACSFKLSNVGDKVTAASAFAAPAPKANKPRLISKHFFNTLRYCAFKSPNALRVYFIFYPIYTNNYIKHNVPKKRSLFLDFKDSINNHFSNARKKQHSFFVFLLILSHHSRSHSSAPHAVL